MNLIEISTDRAIDPGRRPLSNAGLSLSHGRSPRRSIRYEAGGQTRDVQLWPAVEEADERHLRDWEFARWTNGYGEIERRAEPTLQVYALQHMLTARGIRGDGLRFLRPLDALERLASAGMWLVAPMTYARRFAWETENSREFGSEPVYGASSSRARFARRCPAETSRRSASAGGNGPAPYCRTPSMRTAGEAMKPQPRAQVPHFRFRLRHDLSIGPAALKRLWSAACGDENVTVSREPTRTASGDSTYRYCLCGPPHLFDLAHVEARLRTSLQATFPADHVRLFPSEAPLWQSR